MAAVSEYTGSIVSAEIREYSEVQKGFTPFMDGDVLFAKITPCMENGKAAIARNLVNQHGFGSTEFHVIRPKTTVLAEWIYSFIRTTEFRRAAAASFQGAVGQQRVPGSFLETFRIPLPPLSEQKRIVAILQEAEEIRRLREEAERKTAELIPAMFQSVFGDLFFGKSPYPYKLLSEIGDLDRGKSKHRPRDEPSLYGGPYPFLQTGDVAQSNGWITTYTQTYSKKGLEQSRLWPKGTLVITIAANIGATAIMTFDACFPDSVVGFTPFQGISTEYVRWWLLGYQKRLEAQASQGAQKNINLEILRAIKIPVPPVELQVKFQEAVNNLRGQMELFKKGVNSYSALSSSLSAHAFSGHLTAAWRESNLDLLAREAQERDAILSKGKIVLISSSVQAGEAHGTGKIEVTYPDLNWEQNRLLSSITALYTTTASYFTADKLASELDPPFHGHSKRIHSHLLVFAARGFIIPVSRRRTASETGPEFAACYRLAVTREQATKSGGKLQSDDIRLELMEQQLNIAREKV